MGHDAAADHAPVLRHRASPRRCCRPCSGTEAQSKSKTMTVQTAHLNLIMLVLRLSRRRRTVDHNPNNSHAAMSQLHYMYSPQQDSFASWAISPLRLFSACTPFSIARLLLQLFSAPPPDSTAGTGAMSCCRSCCMHRRRWVYGGPRTVNRRRLSSCRSTSLIWPAHAKAAPPIGTHSSKRRIEFTLPNILGRNDLARGSLVP